MSWKSRITSVPPEETTSQPKKSWKDRITQVEEDVIDPMVKQKELEDRYSKLESTGYGALQGATMGFADELEGAIGAGLDKGQALLNKLGLADESPSQVAQRLKDEGFTGDIGETSLEDIYATERDASRKKYKEAEEANPASFTAGNIGAGVATSLIPGLGQLNMAKTAGMGALAGLGNTNADNLVDMGKDVALGAGLGALGKYAGDKLPNAMGAMKNKLDDIAETQAVKSLGFGKKIMENLYQEGDEGVKKVNELGRYLLDEDALRLSAESQAKSLGNLERKVGSSLGEKYSQVGDVDMDNVFRDMMGKARNEAPDLYQAEVNNIRNSAGNIMNETKRSAKDVRNAIGDLDDKIYSPATFNEKPAQFSAKQARQSLDAEFNKQAQADLGEEAFKQMEKDQNVYGLLQNAKKLNQNQVSADASNNNISLTDLLSMGAGATMGGPLGGAGTFLAKKGINDYGNYAMAKGANTFSKVMDVMKQKMASPSFGKYAPAFRDALTRGEDAMNTIHFTLWNTDPEYRKTYEENEKQIKGD